MAPPRIYTAQALSPGTDVRLEAGPSQHIARALRRAPGDPVTLFNGDGLSYAGEITTIERKLVTVRVGAAEAIDVESPLRIHLGVVVSRGERMDWVIQKSTELGVASVAPLYSARGGVRLTGDRTDKKREHWQRVAISACEQCGRNRVPEIGAPMELADWLGDNQCPLRLVLHHRTAGGLPECSPDDIALLVGPEGGLTAEEIEAAQARGWLPLALGPRVLRTETAPLAALAILQARWGDM